MASSDYTPRVWMGGIVGALVGAPVLAVSYLGSIVAGLPFLPFNFFDWIARTLPGGLVTFGIDTMVNVLILFGLDVSEAAKPAENLLGILTLWVIGIVVGVVVFAILDAIKSRSSNYAPGILFGLVLSVPMILINRQVDVTSTAPAIMQVIWIALLLVSFSTFVNWAYNELLNRAAAKAKDEATAAQVEGIDRRSFLVRLGGATATLTVVGAGLGALLDRAGGQGTRTVSVPNDEQPTTTGSGEPLPNADAEVQAAPGTRPEYTPIDDFYRIDILSGLPSIPDDYTLPITGMVANEVEWTLDDIREMPSQEAFITQSCISNRIGGSLISTIKWTGVSFQHILEQIQPDENAEALLITGFDDFDEYLRLDMIREDERIMLAYAFDDEPLPLRNGFPLRIHIPDRYGMKQPKWIRSIEVVPQHQEGYWVRRGWSAEAIVRATSVVDTVAADSIYEDNDGNLRVPVGGIAWAGDRGINSVEVRVDGGEWTEARLREPMSQRSWVIWRYDWLFEEGSHTFEVRCTDGNGDLQILEESGVRPDGATGIHSVEEFLREPAPAEEPTAEAEA